MSLLDREELKALLDQQQGPCVTLTMPTVRAGAETQQNPIRFKNLLRLAQQELGEHGEEAESLLDPVRGLVDDFDFWQHQSEGLAIFLAPGVDRRYRVPRTLEELAVVGDHFHVVPLIPLLTDDGRFHVLALSQNSVRLIEATRFSARELDLHDIPESLQDALGYDVEQRSLQFHSGTGAPQSVAAKAAVQTGGGVHGGTTRRSAMFHGHGSGDDSKEEVEKFLHLVDNGLQRLLRKPTEPLVVAGVEWVDGHFHQVSKHRNLVDGGVVGNPEGWSTEELRDRAWQLVEPHFGSGRETALARWEDLAGSDRIGTELADVLPSATDGRIDTLFVAEGEHRWGRFDRDRRQVEVDDERRNGAEDLLDRAALETLLTGGAVFAVPPDEVPGGKSAVAAIYRY